MIYPLDGILLLCRLAVLAGAESFVDIARFGEKKLELLDMMAIEAAVVTIDSMCKRRRDFAAAGRSKSAARTQARRSPPSGPSCRPMPPGSQGRVDPRRAMSPVMGQMAPPDLGRQGPIGRLARTLLLPAIR